MSVLECFLSVLSGLCECFVVFLSGFLSGLVRFSVFLVGFVLVLSVLSVLEWFFEWFVLSVL